MFHIRLGAFCGMSFVCWAWATSDINACREAANLIKGGVDTSSLSQQEASQKKLTMPFPCADNIPFFQNVLQRQCKRIAYNTLFIYNSFHIMFSDMNELYYSDVHLEKKKPVISQI